MLAKALEQSLAFASLYSSGPTPAKRGKRAIRAKRRNFLFDRPAHGNAGIAHGNRADHHRFYRQP
jgi:hypothetical protein